MSRLAKKLVGLVSGSVGRGAATSGGVTTYTGTVTQVTPTYKVLMDGATEATTCTNEVKAVVGDRVTVEVRNHMAVVKGNITHPTTDDAVAQTAVQAAAEAQAVADAVNQHLWSDSNGVHVTQVEQEDWEDSGSQGYQSGPNILINSLGMLLRNGLNNLTSWTGGAVAFYDGLGNAAGNMVAQFGKTGAYQYVGGVLRSALTAAGLNVYDTDGTTSLAQFGTTVRVGSSSDTNVSIDSDSLIMTASDGNNALKVVIEPSLIDASDSSTGSRQMAYGFRVTNDKNQSYITMTPETALNGQDKLYFTNKLVLNANVASMLVQSAISASESVSASGGEALLSGSSSYLYLRDSSKNLWRLNKTNGIIQFNASGTWTSLYWNATTSRTANQVLAAPDGSDGAASFRALKKGDMPNTSWTYLTGDSSSTNYCRWRMVAGIVFVEYNYASGAGLSTTEKTVGTITSGYRPTKLVTNALYLGTGNNNIASIWVDTSGKVKVIAAASSSYGYGQVVYPLATS